MYRVSKFASLFVLVFIILVQPSYACLCSLGNVSGSFSGSDVVFVGEVVDMRHAKEAHLGWIMKEAGLPKPLEIPKLHLELWEVNSVTLKIVEPLKGVSEKEIVLTSANYDRGGNCAIPFKKDRQFLVFARKRMLYKTDDDRDKSEEAKKENELKIKANEINSQLPTYTVDMCSRTDQLKYKTKELGLIRDFLKNGKWDESELKPLTRIIY